MVHVHKSALVPYRAEQMYDLVNDIAAYPQFVPGCRGARILSRESDRLRASIDLAKGRIHQSFTTENTLYPARRIEMRLVQGPFKSLQGTWIFSPLGAEGCEVTLDMRFEFSSRLIALAFGRFFQELSNSLVDAFCRRAAEIYGRA